MCFAGQSPYSTLGRVMRQPAQFFAAALRPAAIGPWRPLVCLRVERSGARRSRRCAPGFRDVGARPSPQPSTPAGVAGGCAGRLKGFAHATESRTPASGVAPTAWCAATPSARDCKQSGADARRADPALGIAPAEVPTSAIGRKLIPPECFDWLPIAISRGN